MSDADPITTGLVVAAALEAVKQTQDFIAALTGHPGESIATILGNMANRRLKNAETVFRKCQFICLDLGIKPGEVPLNILQPVLEGASLQEDPQLQDVWANLLANAVKDQIEPSFARILRELTSREVRFIDYLYESVGQVYNLQFEEDSLKKQYGLAGLGAADNGFDVMMDVLEANRIMRRITLETMGTIAYGGSTVTRSPAQNLEAFCFTALGIAFVQACRRPERLLQP